MKFSFTSSSSSWLLLVLATPSAFVIGKKGKKTKHIKNKTGGCRTTGSDVPYNGGSQTFGEPLESLDFKAKSYHQGSYQDKYRFDTFDEAWQGCAKQCNWDDRCHTYTVLIAQGVINNGQASTICYLHDPYTSNYVLSKKKKMYTKHGDYYDYHISGVCRLN